MYNKPVRFYLVPKGTRYNTPPQQLAFWRPIPNTYRCMVFDDLDAADECLADVLRSRGRKDIETAYAHKSFRCDYARLSPYERESYRTEPRHRVPDWPDQGTIIVAVAWTREDVLLHDGQMGYKKSTPMTLPQVRIFRYDSDDVPYPVSITTPTTYTYTVHVVRRPQLTWGQLEELNPEELRGGSVLGLFAISNIG